MLHIISPHIDDAILSMGGFMHSLSVERQEVVIYYIFSISPWTNKDVDQVYPDDPVSVSTMRKREEKSVAKKLNYSYVFFDFPDFPLRTHYSTEQTSQMTWAIQQKISALIKKGDQVFFPLGVEHIDHELVRNIGLMLMRDGQCINFYEDLPYCAGTTFDYQSRYNTIVKNGLVPYVREIDIEAKLSLLKLYSSQVSSLWLRDIKNYAYSLNDNKFYERYWQPVSPEKIFKYHQELMKQR